MKCIEFLRTFIGALTFVTSSNGISCLDHELLRKTWFFHYIERRQLSVVQAEFYMRISLVKVDMNYLFVFKEANIYLHSILGNNGNGTLSCHFL